MFKSARILVLFICVLGLYTVSIAQEENQTYLPAVMGEKEGPPPAPTSTPTLGPSATATNKPTPTPTGTNTPTSTNTVTATTTNTPTNTPPPTSTNTPQPTATPTDVPPAGNVEIISIRYNPDGDDVEGEYVRLQNVGGTTDMGGWKLQDEAGATFTFPQFTLEIDAEVQVWTGDGTNDDSNLYWGNNRAIWNNDGDTATLRNQSGEFVDECSYSGGGSLASC